MACLSWQSQSLVRPARLMVQTKATMSWDMRRLLAHRVRGLGKAESQVY
jgi:hypothetical protein